MWPSSCCSSGPSAPQRQLQWPTAVQTAPPARWGEQGHWRLENQHPASERPLEEDRLVTFLNVTSIYYNNLFQDAVWDNYGQMKHRKSCCCLLKVTCKMKSSFLKDFPLHLFLQHFKLLWEELDVLLMENQAWQMEEWDESSERPLMFSWQIPSLISSRCQWLDRGGEGGAAE